MAVIGGSITEISYNHPTLGTGYFYPKSDEEATIDPGGIRTSDDEQGVDGAGNAIYQMTRRRWSVDTTVSSDMNTAKDIERLVALASSPRDAVYTFSHINGTVYRGTGRPVGDIQGAAMAATIGIKFSGGGELRQL